MFPRRSNLNKLCRESLLYSAALTAYLFATISWDPCIMEESFYPESVISWWWGIINALVSNQVVLTEDQSWRYLSFISNKRIPVLSQDESSNERCFFKHIYWQFSQCPSCCGCRNSWYRNQYGLNVWSVLYQIIRDKFVLITFLQFMWQLHWQF